MAEDSFPDVNDCWCMLVSCFVCVADGKRHGGTGNVQLRGKLAKKICDIRGNRAVDLQSPFLGFCVFFGPCGGWE